MAGKFLFSIFSQRSGFSAASFSIGTLHPPRILLLLNYSNCISAPHLYAHAYVYTYVRTMPSPVWYQVNNQMTSSTFNDCNGVVVGKESYQPNNSTKTLVSDAGE